MPTLMRRPAAEHSRRVILLLDLDCFYAQCESVRLGLDPAMPLALLQWNSALAVNYPARALGVKRGDSFEAIREKSGGRCVAMHLPVIPVSGGGVNRDEAAVMTPGEADGGEGAAAAAAPSSLEESYETEFRLPPDERAARFDRERNVMRRPHEGKASLERYRIASAVIFRTATEALKEHLGGGGFVLERASIDELFLDVSAHCYDGSRPEWSPSSSSSAREDGNVRENGTGARAENADSGQSSVSELASTETVVCAAGSFELDEEGDEIRALRRGCAVARGVRKAVFDRLGFTLSAGISVNKMMAKLGASYGKPNGQAVVFPQAVPEVLKDTEIRKVRHFGGKAGKKVLALLPEGETFMGSIARLLTLNQLVGALGQEAAQHAFDAARGVDHEEVTETKGALTKSITAFKSFPRTNFEGLQKWIMLLATDICERVQLDSKRNNRYPKNCNIQYIYLDDDNRVARSLRVPLPKTNSTSHQKEELMKKVKNKLQEKGKFPINRLGLSAVDFETMATGGGIQSFFQSKKSPSKAPEADFPSKTPEAEIHADYSRKGEDSVHVAQRELVSRSYCSDGVVKEPEWSKNAENGKMESVGQVAALSVSDVIEASRAREVEHKCKEETLMAMEGVKDNGANETQYEDDLELARKIQEQLDKEGQSRSGGLSSSEARAQTVEKVSSDQEDGSDFVYARKLQALYDRENSALSAFDLRAAKPTKRALPRGQSGRKVLKKNRIENFFQRKDR